jgi:hypothetical protein
VISETAELLQWLSEEDEEQDDFSSDLVLPINAFGPDLDNTDGDLSDAVSDLAHTVLVADWRH